MTPLRLVAAVSLLFVAACSVNDASEYSSLKGAVDGNSPDGADGSGTDGKGGASGAGGTASGTGANGAAIHALAPSCATQHGGQTCGAKGNEDCCSVAQQGDAKINKYMVTAGRMRTFVQHFNGDIAGYVKTLPADKWKDEWNVDVIPTDLASADVTLGPFAGKKSCQNGGFTGHTYWTPKTDDDFSDFDQATLDEKALNCVPWQMLQAICAWDGGHLATVAELKAAFTNGGTTRFPWGNDGLDSVSAPDAKNRLNIEGAFQTDPLPATFRKRDDGLPAEVSFEIAPPGRFAAGNNAVGIADSAGNLLEWAGDQPRQFVWKADFEQHGADAAGFDGGYIWMDARGGFPVGLGFGPWIWGDSQLYGNAGNGDEKNGYYSIGGRCAF